MKTTPVYLIPLVSLVSSPLNPRQHFDAAAITELAANIRQHGVLTALLVRPQWCRGTQSAADLAKARPAGEWQGGYEIVSGECRWRACKEIDLAEVPAKIAELTDPELLVMNLAEQMAGKQLTPMEEAASFKKLLTYKNDDGSARHTVESLAKELGFSSLNSIYERLRLVDLPAAAATALNEGRIGMKIASQIARIPDKELRGKAAAEILKGNDGEPMTKKQAEQFIADNFMRSLKGAPFDQEEATLLAGHAELGAATACSGCPHRTGNNKAVFGDVKRGDVCTRPACYQAKLDATLARRAAEAKAAGKKVLGAAESAEIFPPHFNAGQMSYSSKLVELDTKPEAHLLKAVVKNVPTWRELAELLVGKGMKPQVYAVTDQTGRMHDMAEAAVLIAGADKAGEPIFRGKNEPASPADQEFKKRQQEEAAESKVRSLVAVAAFDALRVALVKAMAGEGRELWQAVGSMAFDALGGEGAAFLGKWQKLAPDGMSSWGGVVGKWFKKLPEREQEALIPLVLCAEKVRWHGVKAVGVQQLADWLKVDLKAIEKGVRDGIKAKKGKSPESRVESPKVAGKKPAKGKAAADKAVAAVKGSLKAKGGKRGAK